MSATDSTPKTPSPYQNKRVNRGLRTDRIRPEDLKRFNLAMFCDDCGHYDGKRHLCTMGFLPVHTRSEQMAQYDLNGTMAFCRFCEID